MKPIRLAIIQCDNHAYWYAPLLAEADALKLRERASCCHYFMSDFYFPGRITAKRTSGFELTNVWDADRNTAEVFADTFLAPPRVCGSIEECTEGIDAVLISECGGDGSTHLERVVPFLKRGIPAFIDKPFTLTTKDAKELAALARKHGAPIFSSSILGYVPEVNVLRTALKEFATSPTSGTGGTKFIEDDLGRPRFGVVRGCWGWATESGLEGVIHGLTLAQAVFGPGVESVQAIGSVANEYMVLRYRSGLEVAVLNHPFKNGYGFSCEAFTARRYPYKSSYRIDGIEDPSFIEGAQRILNDFKRMVRTGKPPISVDSMIELIATAEAGASSQKLGRPVRLSELLVGTAPRSRRTNPRNVSMIHPQVTERAQTPARMAS